MPDNPRRSLFLLRRALRIASLTSFISRSVLHGFGLGLAITISIRQLPALLGVASHGATPWETLISLIGDARDIHLPSVALGAIALIILGVSKRLKFASAGLILIVAATLLMRLGSASHFGIATAGALNFHLRVPQLPAIEPRDWLRLAQFAFPIAIVLLAESWATIRSLASIRGDPIVSEREIAALGLANLASGILRGLPVGAGFSIGNANAQAGTTSRIGALFGAAGVAILVVAVPNWIALIPQPLLAAIVISALSHALSPKPIIELFHLKRDQWPALAAVVGVLALGITNGLLVAVALSLMGLLRRLADPSLSELGRVRGHDFVDLATHSDAKAIPGILIIRPDAPLFFGNADLVLGEVAKRANSEQSRTIVLSLEESDDLDSSALEVLVEFKRAIEAQSRSLILARVHDRARGVLERGGLTELAATSTFSVDDAVRAASGSGIASSSSNPSKTNEKS